MSEQWLPSASDQEDYNAAYESSIETAAFSEPPLSPLETLRGAAAFLRHYLENYVVSVPVTNRSGHTINRFAAVQIPDWAVKQEIQEIDEAIKAEKARLGQ